MKYSITICDTFDLLQSLTVDAAKTLVQEFTSSRLDYCNGLNWIRGIKDLALGQVERRKNKNRWSGIRGKVSASLLERVCRPYPIFFNFGV